MRRIAATFAIMAICVWLNSCSHIPISEKGLSLGKDTSASIDDIDVGKVNSGVGRVTRQF